MSREAPLEQVGSIIAGRYEVEELLGRGGMAAVYRVSDQRTGQRVALKRGWSKDQDKLQRNAALLEREYHTLAQLAHPRIIAVYDYGLDERGPYYTMELLDGADMESTGKLPWKQACAVLRDVASSLAILHSRGLVHRDVSSRNVRYSSNGYVKLLDFGAMTSVGVAKDVVGTPRFMAPEMLVMQTLDARTDLFALGALGYFLLTGRDAYPARRMSDLRDVWRSRPQAPARIAEDVPAPLSALVMRLLTIDRSGRPQHAAEVIEQLTSLASLPREDLAEISHAYLNAPTLIGRDEALLELRRRVLALVRGDGGVLCVRGEPGTGRSRLLDACALEAKLLGPAVIRVDARDATSGEWGVARAVARQLVSQFPRQAIDGMRLSREILGHVIEDLREESTQTAGGVDRSLLIRELRDFVLSLSRAQRLMLVVDDADRIDEPSMAWLAAVGHKADRNPILIVASSEVEQRPATAATLRLLSGLSQPIELKNLAADETEALLRSVFGDVRNLTLCAARIHGLSRGNPRAALELAQHLVDSGRARYEAGSWVLPSALDEADMPASLAASLSARVAELGADARELLDAMVLADGDMLAIQDFRDLTSHGDTRRVFAALDELASTRIVVLDGDRCDIAQRGFSSVVQQAMPEERRKLIHGRLADSLTTTGGDVLRRAHHLLAAGRDRRAIELLCSVDLAARMPPVQLLATAIDRADELGLPAATRHRLHMALLINAPFALASESFRKIAPIVLRQLDRDSGLARYRELAGLAPNERLSQALAQTHQAYLATPEHERVHSVIEAIGELVRVSGSLAAMASPVFDLELLETLPQVEPLLPLSPALQVASLLVSGAKDWVRGRVRLSYATYMKVLERVAEPDHAGLDDAQYDRIRLGLLYTVGLLEAASGLPAAERRAQSIENHRELRVNAWRMRSILQLALGNPDEARRCGRRAQLLQAQEGVRERYVGSAVGTELLGYARLGDMLGVKSVLDGLATLAADHPGWVPIELMGRALYAELQRDLEAALHLVEAALNASAQMPAQPYFAPIAARHLHILRELGQGDRACLLARVYVERAKAQQLNFYDLGLAAGLALARFGHYEEALPHVQLVIDEAEQVGRQGFALAAVYETRARIALWMNDRESFESYMDRCSRLHDPEKHPVIGALLARLVEEGRQHGMIPTEVAVSLRHSFRPSTVESEYETIHSRIAECVDLPDRARCALTLLLQNTVSSTGYLYGMGEDRSVQLLAALPDMPANDLDSWIAQYALETLEEEDSATGSASQSATGSARLAPLRYVDSEGRWYEAALLFDEIQQRRVLAAALVLQVDATHRTMPSPELRNRIAKELLEHGDVRGWR